MWELDHKESWAPKNWCFWTGVLEKPLESPLGCKEIQPVHIKGDQSWIFVGRTDAEAETPILWPPDAKSWPVGKAPEAGKDWGQEEKGTTEDEMVGWHHRLDGREFERAPGVGGGQGGLACYGPWSHRESDTTEWGKSSSTEIILWGPTEQQQRPSGAAGTPPQEMPPCPRSPTASRSDSLSAIVRVLFRPASAGSHRGNADTSPTSCSPAPRGLPMVMSWVSESSCSVVSDSLWPRGL